MPTLGQVLRESLRTQAVAGSIGSHRIYLYANFSFFTVSATIANALRNYSNFYSVAIYLSKAAVAFFGIHVSRLCRELNPTSAFFVTRDRRVLLPMTGDWGVAVINAVFFVVTQHNILSRSVVGVHLSSLEVKLSYPTFPRCYATSAISLPRRLLPTIPQRYYWPTRSIIWKSFLSISLGFLDAYASLAASPLPTATTDVVIIGGGSAGTYTAIRLQQQGKSVFVIEKEDVLGGHTNTFHTWGLLDVGARTIKYAKLNGGDATATTTAPTFVSWSNATNVGLALPVEGYLTQIAKYAPFLTTGYDLPDPVPEELLMPWGAFARKHGIEAFDYTLFTFNEGSGNMLAQPTLYVLKYFTLFDAQILAGIQPGFLTTAAHNNHALYDAALARLQAGANNSAVAVSSNVTRIVRSASSVHPTDAAQPHIAGPGPDGQRTNINARALSAQFNNSYYWNMVIAGTGIPDNLFIDAVDFAAPTPSRHCRALAYFGSPHHMSDAQVKAETVAALRRLAHANGWDNNGTFAPEFVGFHSHAPFLLTVDVGAVRNGFYRRLNALQGVKNTWWTGAAWQAPDSSLI
ncbi:hypothetical protein GGX14DRAFT_576705 [Mycena pura]|uniref:FAD/NAD(P)-binding domain-containing protein n=1 Tax=Mycena pura TaxID=153505 RepID=A0AAD6USW0_9AGAR|nr:hypothetical protein GGX14DRAFT_576705 [Mycena pura]